MGFIHPGTSELLLLAVAVANAVIATRHHQKPKQNKDFPWFDPSYSFNDRVDMLVGNMTANEKISQMVKFSQRIDRLGVPGYNYHMEAAHGVATGGDSTVFPCSLARAASFNPELESKIAMAIAIEARAKWNEYIRLHGTTPAYNSEGLALTLYAPEINLCRDPRWGRCQESRGEDPYLSGSYTVEFVKAVQNHPLSDKYWLTTAMLKDFVVYNLESSQPVGGNNWQYRLQYNAIVPEADLHMSFLPAFYAGIVDGNARSVMTSYHALNGIPTTAHPVLNDILRKTWGWDGVIASDGGAVSYITKFQYLNLSMADNTTAAAEAAVKATVDMNSGGFMRAQNPENCTGCMTNMSGFAYAHLPVSLAKDPRLIDPITTSVKRLMKMRMKLGFFDPPERNPFSKFGAEDIDTDASRELARLSAVQALVLLHTNGQLPISVDAEAIKRRGVAIIGPNANNTTPLLSDYNGCSNWTMRYANGKDPSPPCRLITPLVAAQEFLTPLKVPVTYDQGCALNSSDKSGIAEAITSAKNAAVAIVVLGLESGDGNKHKLEGEAHDRVKITLPGMQLQLAQEILKAQPNTIIVFMSGGIISEPSLMENPNAMAIIQQFYPGEMGGTALIDAIFGQKNATIAGRLPVTIYKDLKQLPPYLVQNMSVGPGRTYRYSKVEPYFSFGYGCSYHSFLYSNMSVHQSQMNNEMIATVDVENVASVSKALHHGEEVVQLYLACVSCGIGPEDMSFIPQFELKGYQRIQLTTGKKQQVQFHINLNNITLFVDGKMKFNSGKYMVWIGGSSPNTSEKLLYPNKLWGPRKAVNLTVELKA